MVHTEQILVYRLQATPDYYGGQSEAYALLTPAPTWATIVQDSGQQISFMGGSPLEKRFTVSCNDVQGFEWKQGDLIDSRFGYISIDTITEAERKRTNRCTGNIITVDNFAIV